MTKKKAKVVPFLSPENYIRQKAKNLPIHECWVNEDWNISKLADVVVTRMHTNGDITACFYLVDLMCLGLKNTRYFFNMPPYEYDEILEKMKDAYAISSIPYALAHNIIFAGIEYGAEYGFRPHKDFTSITANMLEDDTDEIELIEIECGGQNGKPCYVQGPFLTSISKCEF